MADGQAANWTLHRLHFPDFTAITDFIHPVSYIYNAAAAISSSAPAPWSQYTRWLTACWQGRVNELIAELDAWLGQHRLPEDVPLQHVSDQDPRKIVHESLTYLRNNCRRMDYPRYRREGLPITSALVESLIKEFNLRVKGTEKLWNRHENDPDKIHGAESILQVRAALLSDDDRLSKHIASRPGSPFFRRRLAATGLPV